MKREDLIAPSQYNLVMEIEKYAKDDKRVAVKWEDQEGKTKEITYQLLMLNANRFGNVFLKSGLKKAMLFLIMFLV